MKLARCLVVEADEEGLEVGLVLFELMEKRDLIMKEENRTKGLGFIERWAHRWD